MVVKAKTKLTNIRPREVSLVDEPANKKDFLVVKNQDGEMTPVEDPKPDDDSKEKPAEQPAADPKPAEEPKEAAQTETTEGTKKEDQPVLKKLEVAVHSINFFKSQYPDVEKCKKVLIENGLNPDMMEMRDLDWEYQFVVNPESAFEGTSLAMASYVPMTKGCDSLVGVLKGMAKEELEVEITKAGASLSKANLEKLQSMYDSIGKMIEAAKPTEKKEGDVKKDNEGDSEILKKLEGMEKKYDTEIKKRDDKIADLEKRLEKAETTPADPAGSAPDNTQQIQKKNENFWNGVL